MPKCPKVPGRQKSIMVFGAIWHTGLRILERVNGTMDGKQYVDILRQNVLPLLEEDQLLQQDNAPCHKSLEVMTFMENNGIGLLPQWPARSPDLNIIENLWDYLKKKVRQHSIANLEELWTVLQHEFYNIPDSLLLVYTIQCRYV